ncbi:SapC family protein [Ruegeria sp.]|uniref:SapC family protein n=1 Tax=Ruegeria sp. TaxID=1879320 RepID=UPI002319B0F0|nr:SapC family protein [Ruegeria sp.]MDA7963996.1 SapC family protein [Ruegeria sp.]
MAQNGLFPVSISRHKDRYWRPFTSYSFARGLRESILVAAEILPAAAALPIAFRQQEEGVLPVALLSMDEEADTPVVSAGGQWLAGYVPSALRCHPFCAEPVKDAVGSSRLCVDEASGLVTTNRHDQAFFAETGDLAPELRDILSFFQARQFALAETQKLCTLLEKMGLLTPLDRHEGHRLPDGLMGVSGKRLERLSQAQMTLLLNSGALQMIHAHQVSLSHCGWLSRARQQITTTSANSEDLSGFITALATDAANPHIEWEAAHAV